MKTIKINQSVFRNILFPVFLLILLHNGDAFAQVPSFQLSLTPGLGTRGWYSGGFENSFSLNLIGGNTLGTAGFELGGVFNLNRKDTRYAQIAGVFNQVGENVRGAQIAGVANIVGRQAIGVQLAGVLNTAEKHSGLQVAGVSNITQLETGSQISGVINIAGKVRGVQISGLLNVADSSDYPIGLINIIRSGTKSLSAGADESGMVHLAFRSGGRVLYGLVAAGYHTQGTDLRYAAEAGVGVHMLNSSRFLLDAELVHRVATDFGGEEEAAAALRLLPAVRVGGGIELFAGPTVNFTYAENGIQNRINGWIWHQNKAQQPNRIWYAGAVAGMRYSW